MGAELNAFLSDRKLRKEFNVAYHHFKFSSFSEAMRALMRGMIDDYKKETNS